MFWYARIPEHAQYLMPKAPYCEYVYMCMCVFKFFFEITEPNEDKVHMVHHRIGEKIYLNDSGQLLFFILLSAPGGGGGGGGF